MYLAGWAGSKNAACIRPDKLRRIFRKLRLADLQQSCRLPLGVGGSIERPNSRFAIRNVSYGKRKTDALASGLLLLPVHPRADSGPFLYSRPEPSTFPFR